MEKKAKRLALCGKVISIEKIGQKSFKQFVSQCKLAGVQAKEMYLLNLYNRLGGKDAVKESK